uniref:Uncharacterized protein n=1 Tax=Romanomermis culicivorax TaxID=13658 RepID=A0A915K764_ROMCU
MNVKQCMAINRMKIITFQENLSVCICTFDELRFVMHQCSMNRKFYHLFEESGKQIPDALKHVLRNQEFHLLFEESGLSRNRDICPGGLSISVEFTMKLYRSKSNGFAEEQDFRIIKNFYLFIRAKALYLEAVGLLRRKNISDAYNYLIFVKIVTKNLFAEASVMPSPKKEMINRWRADPNRSFRDQIIELRDAAIVKI